MNSEQDKHQPEAPSDQEILAQKVIARARVAVMIMGVILLLGFASVVVAIWIKINESRDEAPRVERVSDLALPETLLQCTSLKVADDETILSTYWEGNRLLLRLERGSEQFLVFFDLKSCQRLGEVRLTP